MSIALQQYFQHHRLQFVSGCWGVVKRGYMTFHRHDALEVIHQFGGEGVVTTASGSVVTANRSQVLLLPAAVPHDHHQYIEGETFNLLLALPQPVPIELQDVLCVAADYDLPAIRELHDLARTQTVSTQFAQLCLDYHVTSLFLRLLAQRQAIEASPSVASPAAENARIAERADAYLVDNFRTIERVEQVAEALGYSTDYMRHLFKREFGIGLSERLTQLRLQEAKYLLTSTDWSQKSIAHLSGFRDHHYFCRRFRELEFCSPNEFRMSAQCSKV